MSREVVARPLTAEAFAPFGDVLEAAGPPDRLINRGLCGRWHDRARLDLTDGRAGISIFRADPRALPFVLDLVERHPDGSQAFLPMTADPFLVVVAPDDGGAPGRPLAFLTAPGQGVNYARGTWHGVLTPLAAPGLFAVVDRIGPGANLEEHVIDPPWTVCARPDSTSALPADGSPA
jgi:ureidoglycolate lyase